MLFSIHFYCSWTEIHLTTIVPARVLRSLPHCESSSHLFTDSSYSLFYPGTMSFFSPLLFHHALSCWLYTWIDVIASDSNILCCLLQVLVWIWTQLIYNLLALRAFSSSQVQHTSQDRRCTVCFWLYNSPEGSCPWHSILEAQCQWRWVSVE